MLYVHVIELTGKPLEAMHVIVLFQFNQRYKRCLLRILIKNETRLVNSLLFDTRILQV